MGHQAFKETRRTTMGPRITTLALALVCGAGLLSACASTDSIDTGINGGQTSTNGAGGTGGQGGAHGGAGGGSSTTTTGSGGTGGASTGTGGTGGGTAGAGGGTGGGTAGGGTGGGTAGAGGGTGGGTAGGGGTGGTGGTGGGTAGAGGGTGGAGGCESKAEKCNGLDDNCNGQVDEGNPESGLLCVAAGMGECKKGTSQCINGAVKCIPGEKQPEVCDGLDNNCDGNVDEGNPGGGLPCTTEFLGVCKSGITKCDGINGVICKPSVVPGSLSESCNGLDDDCDGVIDNAVSQVGQACQVSSNLGECKNGTYSCPTSPPFQLKCDTPSPVQETCNGKDDDCNGSIDDGAANNQSCDTGLDGVCSAGKTSCQGGSSTCVQQVQASTEVCDNKDNNCNGTVDEGNPGGGGTCTALGAVGECKNGTYVCTSGSVLCEAGSPQTETCNGKDDDCDGVADNGNPGGGVTCTSGKPGICSPGKTACTGGSIVCNADIQPGTVQETCNGKDDDCNGTVDDGAASNQNCDTGKPGVCSAGKTSCQSGSSTCVQQVAASNEICDGLDNNCNGVADEGNPGGGGACTALGAIGECRKGTFVCMGGSIICVAGSPQNETCDGLDNNCDGVIDNGNPGGGAACSSGKPGICSAGTTACTGGTLVCNANIQPGTVAETCNNKDDDCNGAIDDNLNGFACATGLPGICSTGKTLCSSGSQSCVPDVQPGAQAEICDGKDNDCNGNTDEMNPTATCTTQYPSAVHVSAWSCSSTCQIATCGIGYANINGAIADGCECSSDQHATACASAGTLSVAVGTGALNPVVMEGVIETAGGSDYVKFNFPVRAIPQNWHPTIKLTNNQGGQYAMDVQSTCGVNATCNDGGTGANVNTWEVNYVYPSNPPSSIFNNDSNIKPTTLIVRVYRKNGDAPTCARYRVEATNP